MTCFKHLIFFCYWHCYPYHSLIYLRESRNRRNTICNIFHLKHRVAIVFFCYMTIKFVFLNIFPCFSVSIESEIGNKEKVEFNEILGLAIFEIFQIWTKHMWLEWISSYVLTFETFVSSLTFICNWWLQMKGWLLLNY